jgi:hypothetical protein
VTVAEMRAAVEQVLSTVPFEPPVGVPYCVQVRDALRVLAPAAQLDVMHRHTSLHVELREGDRCCALSYPLV